jgi:hypothetical protein
MVDSASSLYISPFSLYAIYNPEKEMGRYQDKMRKSALGDGPPPASDSPRSEE